MQKGLRYTLEFLQIVDKRADSKNDASFHALSSGETEASLPAPFEQENDARRTKKA